MGGRRRARRQTSISPSSSDSDTQASRDRPKKPRPAFQPTRPSRLTLTRRLSNSFRSMDHSSLSLPSSTVPEVLEAGDNMELARRAPGTKTMRPPHCDPEHVRQAISETSQYLPLLALRHSTQVEDGLIARRDFDLENVLLPDLRSGDAENHNYNDNDDNVHDDLRPSSLTRPPEPRGSVASEVIRGSGEIGPRESFADPQLPAHPHPAASSIDRTPLSSSDRKERQVTLLRTFAHALDRLLCDYGQAVEKLTGGSGETVEATRRPQWLLDAFERRRRARAFEGLEPEAEEGSKAQAVHQRLVRSWNEITSIKQDILIELNGLRCRRGAFHSNGGLFLDLPLAFFRHVQSRMRPSQIISLITAPSAVADPQLVWLVASDHQAKVGEALQLLGRLAAESDKWDPDVTMTLSARQRVMDDLFGPMGHEWYGKLRGRGSLDVRE